MPVLKASASSRLGVSQRGTRILAERSIFTVRADRELLPAFKNISAPERAYIRNLSINLATKAPLLRIGEAAWHVTRDAIFRSGGLFSIFEYRDLLAAFRNNNFDIGEDRRAIFNEISRFNHSCVPNAQGNFNTAIRRFTVHAVRAIEREEELSISYLDEHGAVRDARQARLSRHYGFECRCPACDVSVERGRESERRRGVVRERLMAFASGAAERSERDLKAELEMLLELVRMFEVEGLVGRELATM